MQIENKASQDKEYFYIKLYLCLTRGYPLNAASANPSKLELRPRPSLSDENIINVIALTKLFWK